MNLLLFIVDVFWVFVMAGISFSLISKNQKLETKLAKYEFNGLKEGDEIFVRMFYTDERGNMVKHRNFTIIDVFHRQDEIPFVQLAGNEPQDQEYRSKNFNL